LMAGLTQFKWQHVHESCARERAQRLKARLPLFFVILSCFSHGIFSLSFLPWMLRLPTLVGYPPRAIHHWLLTGHLLQARGPPPRQPQLVFCLLQLAGLEFLNLERGTRRAEEKLLPRRINTVGSFLDQCFRGPQGWRIPDRCHILDSRVSTLSPKSAVSLA